MTPHSNRDGTGCRGNKCARRGNHPSGMGIVTGLAHRLLAHADCCFDGSYQRFRSGNRHIGKGGELATQLPVSGHFGLA